MANKTTMTPAEHANASQALNYWDNLRFFANDAADIETSDILAVRVVREPQAVVEIVARARINGDASATVLDVKKNGTSILTTAITMDNADADGTVYIAIPDTDAKGLLAPGDILTIESGATVATNTEDVSCEVRIAKVFATSNG